MGLGGGLKSTPARELHVVAIECLAPRGTLKISPVFGPPRTQYSHS